VNDGDYVEKDQEIVEVDSDKATLAIPAPESGTIKIVVEAGETVAVGSVICTLDTGTVAPKKVTGDALPVTAKPVETTKEASNETLAPSPPRPVAPSLHISPLARKLMDEKDLTEDQVNEMLKSIRIGKKDIEELVSMKGSVLQSFATPTAASRDTERKKMSMLRIKLAQRLVEVKNTTAMLTTFNEVDMSALLAIKAKYNDKFKEKYGFGVGFMSFFTKAAAIALREFPMVNAQIDGDELLIPSYVDMGIAVSAPKGLMVPVIRNAETLSLMEIEAKVKELAGKARNSKISLEEMTGGTFTITNGGVFGSMMSTPILNPPQSAILGMHNIVERPVAIHGKVEIRPIMYVALSYDHRVIDGRESVSFLVRLKEMIEEPVKMMFDGKDPNITLLGL
jgi:2-oxoglutarate dehydrogenase E2 component (dihydrolipoamide succinyltransferase)